MSIEARINKYFGGIKKEEGMFEKDICRKDLNTRLHSLLSSVRYLTNKGKITPMHSSNYELAILDVLSIVEKL